MKINQLVELLNDFDPTMDVVVEVHVDIRTEEELGDADIVVDEGDILEIESSDRAITVQYGKLTIIADKVIE